MRCPYCGFEDSKVTDSRVVDSGIRRRRECQQCSLRFTTYERIQAAALMVSKRDNRREEFNREKLVSGIRKACAKRPIASRTIEKMVEDIETELQHMGHVEVPSDIIGEMVVQRLKNLDRVAYIRYASVYRDFQDIESFEIAVKDLKDENTQLPLPQMAAERGKRRRRARAASQHLSRKHKAEGSNGSGHTSGLIGDTIHHEQQPSVFQPGETPGPEQPGP